MMTEPIAHTVVTHEDGSVHVQHFGAGHIVDGSVRVIEVPAGVTVVIRHIQPEEAP